jgi:hypothetical protein
MIGQQPPPNRDRFLAAIAERVSPERVQALFLFSPMRQGPVETGVAVLAIDQPVPAPFIAEPTPMGMEVIEQETGVQRDETAVLQTTEHTEDTETPRIRQEDVGETAAGSPLSPLDPSPIPLDPRSSLLDPRPIVLTARYRHTLKGADRGKWELEIFEQADAPLATIEMVVRGVQQRLDDASEPERLGAEHLRAALAEGVWTPPQR